MGEKSQGNVKERSMREIEKCEGEMGRKSQGNVEERSVREAGEKWKMGEKSQGN